MRLRNENLKTGKALTWIDPAGRWRTRALLFLVQGADDIDVLSGIQSVCDRHIAERGYGGFAWRAVADPGQISLVDNRLFNADLARFEAAEFGGLDPDSLATLLKPVIDHIVAGDAEMLPRAGGAVGSPAEGIQFLNRLAELDSLASRVRAGESLFLHAPRRMGKTSLMRRLQAVLDGDHKTIALNIERDPTPAEVAARFRSLAAGEGYRTAQRSVQSNPMGALRESTGSVCRNSDKPLVLFIDELAALFEGIRQQNAGEGSRRSEVLAFLSALAEPLAEHGARLVIAGSVDCLDYLRAELGLPQEQLPGLFSRMQRVSLKPLDFRHPECELRRVLLGSAIVATPEDLDWLHDHVDLTVPFPALKFLDLLVSEVKRAGSAGPAQCQELFRDFVATTESFDDFDAHIRRKVQEVRNAAETISAALDLIAREPFESGVSEGQVQAILMELGPAVAATLQSWLLETFPVLTEASRVKFASRFFRHWWRSQMRDGAPDGDE
jgi:hypothetical protein